MIKKAVKYQLFEMKKTIMIYYGVMIAIYLVLSSATSNQGIVSGSEVTTAIFLFVVGLNSFTNSFKMFLQNGISRETLFCSYSISTTIVAVFMAFVTSIVNIVMNIFFNYELLYFQIYGGGTIGNNNNGFVKFIGGFLWTAFLYMMAIMLGYFITTLYYRMNTKLKIFVSVGVPGFLLIGIPYIEYNWTNGRISEGIFNFVTYAFGITNGYNPCYFMVTSLVILMILGVLSYSLIRRAVVKTS